MQPLIFCRKSLFVILLTLSGVSVFSQDKMTVYFDFDKYVIKESEELRLDSLFKMNEAHFKALQFELVGHCDSVGSNDYNQRLSEKRSKAIQKWLIGHGSNKNNFKAVAGAGKREPLNENLTGDERALNRRVELVIYKDIPVATITEQIADSTTIAGTNIVLRNINFVGGQHVFLPGSEPMLQELLNAMKKFPNLVIQVEGHICCVAGPDDGPDSGTGLNNLSEARALVVRNYLISNGIAADRVSYKGFGHANPVYPYPEKSEYEREYNRRVEIKIIRK